MPRRSPRSPARRTPHGRPRCQPARGAAAPWRNRATARRGLASLVVAAALGALVVPATATATTNAADVTASAFDPALVGQLEEALDAEFEKTGAPGVIVGVWIPGHGEWVSSRGVADLGTLAPMTRGNQQKIGSITKTIVATVALQVISDGSYDLTLDSTIDRWYPGIPEASKITVRMLLNMSSGIGNSPQGQVDRICADPYATLTPDEVIAANLAYPRAPFAPGEGFDYANVNLYIAGRILEQVTGTDLETLVHDGVTAPLGMTRSRFAGDGQLVAPFARGYTWFCPNLPQPADTTDWPGNEEWAGGAMVSTLDDLRTWGDALGTGELLTPTARAAQLDDATPRGIPGTSYGLGVNVLRDPATGCVTLLNHAGAEPGYQSDLYAFPTTGATMALLGNGNGYDGDLNAIVRAIYPLLVDSLVVTPTESCESPTTPQPAPPTPAPAPVAATPVAVAPRFTG